MHYLAESYPAPNEVAIVAFSKQFEAESEGAEEVGGVKNHERL